MYRIDSRQPIANQRPIYIWKTCAGVGDAVRIGEGTTAVLRGKQAAYEIAQELGVRFNYNDYLQISKEYIDSQQHPIRIKEESPRPTPERQAQRPFVRLDCLYGFACNPCSFACPQKAITKSSTSVTPEIDYEKCTGCMQCVSIVRGWLFSATIPGSKTYSYR